MASVADLLRPLSMVFPASRRGRERARWFLSTMLAIIMPFSTARTSNLLRTLHWVFGERVSLRRYYTFMASPKLRWEKMWTAVWRMIPSPHVDGRLLVAIDDSINPKTGRKIFGCEWFFDHAAKANQTRYAWSQQIVTIGLLKQIKGRWACLPLAFRFYHTKKVLAAAKMSVGRTPVMFETKIEQAREMLISVARILDKGTILAVTDSWFGNRGFLKPLRDQLGHRVHLLSRLRSNAVLSGEPTDAQPRRGRPRKYGDRLGTTSEMAVRLKPFARPVTLNLYGRSCEQLVADRVLMLRSLRARVRVVWIYRKTTWVALFTTDLDLTVEQVIQYYAARWKIEAAFKELKQEIGSARSQTRNPVAVTNHLHFCMMAATLIWIHTDQASQTPTRLHNGTTRRFFAFSDARRQFTQAVKLVDLRTLCHDECIRPRNSFLSILVKMAA